MEVQTADALGISRTPVREALQVLFSEGFIEEKKGKGYQVPRVSIKEVHEIYFFIGLTEAILVRGQGQVSLEVIAKLKETNRALKRKTASRKDQINLDRSFHQTLIEAAKNDTAKKILGGLRQKSLRYEFLNYQNKERLKHSAEEHLEVIKFLEKGDLEEAAKKVEEHWQMSATRLETALEKMVGVADGKLSYMG